MNKQAAAKAMMATFCAVVAVLALLFVIVVLCVKFGPGPLIAIPVGCLVIWCTFDEFYKYFKRQP